MAGTYNILINRGNDFSKSLTFYVGRYCDGVKRDVSASTFYAQIRPEAGSATLTETFAIDTTDAANGKIILSLTDTETQAITAGTYAWDLLENASGNKATKVGGSVTVNNVVSES